MLEPIFGRHRSALVNITKAASLRHHRWSPLFVLVLCRLGVQVQSNVYEDECISCCCFLLPALSVQQQPAVKQRFSSLQVTSPTAARFAAQHAYHYTAISTPRHHSYFTHDLLGYYLCNKKNERKMPTLTIPGQNYSLNKHKKSY